MQINTTQIVRYLTDEYKRFLKTSFRFLDQELKEQFEKHLDTAAVVVKGPLVSLSREFTQGPPLKDLVNAKKADPSLLRAHWPFGDEALYLHQEKCLETGRAGRCFIVTTGTGSGKTEAFLLPVIDGIIRAKRESRQGVQAVFVYPMNALANDQLERLRRLLRGTGLDVSFGLYTGDSDAASKNLNEAPAESERLTRADIKRRPPDILLTNYKQLEFLLIRKEDRHLFTLSLRYLVLDELHSYRGALATEIACLLRRLKSHAGLAPGQLTAIGTSATVSSSTDGRTALAEFASELFGEIVHPEDIIGESVEPPPAPATPWLGPFPAITDEEIAALDCTSEDAVAKLAEHVTGKACPSGVDMTARLTALLKDNRLVHALEECLHKARDLTETAIAIRENIPERAKAPEDALRREIEAYLILGSIGDEAHPPRLRPKFHLFFHGIYDVWICTNPECRRLLFHGAGECPVCGSQALAAALCRTCGQDFAKARFEGDEDNRKLIGTSDFESGSQTVFLTHKLQELPKEEDEEETENPPKGKGAAKAKTVHGLERVYLCSGCGQLQPREGPCASCGGTAWPYWMHRGKMNTCPSCEDIYTRGDIVMPLRTGTASTVSVLMTHHLDSLADKDRKLLVFADNRQDAAHQAGYTADKHRNFALRHVVAEEVARKGEHGISINELVHAMLERYRAIGIIGRKNLTEDEKEKWLLVITYELAMEITEHTRQRASLENLGLMAVEYEFLDRVAAVPAFTALCQAAEISQENGLKLTRLILDAMRKRRAVSFDFFQEYIDPDRKRRYSELERDFGVVFPARTRMPKAFALDRPDHLRKAASGRLLGFFQENQGAGNLTAVQKLVSLLVTDRYKSEDFLTALVPILLQEEILVSVPRFPLPKGGAGGVQALQISPRVLRLTRPKVGFRCNACRVWRPFSFSRCPNPRCAGTLNSAEVEQDNYYVQFYTKRPPRRMAIEEHSAQIDPTERARREAAFKEGKIDALVCTPTLELGVDIGPLLTVLLRNAPPTPANYIQRVGRAGRRLRIGFVGTFCAGGAHDRHVFEHPEWMAAGEFTPPRLRLDNIRIVGRHLRAFVLESLDAQLPGLMRDFLDDAVTPTRWKPEVLESLYDEMRTRSGELISRLERLFVHDREAGRIKSYNREDCSRVIGEFSKHLTSALDSWWGRVRMLVKEHEAYKAIGADIHAKKKAAARERAYREITSDPERAYALNYFSTQGLLPAYQFPIDVFSLDPGVADTPTLYRPSAIAIEEFAPGNFVYANRRKLRSIRVLFAGGPGAGDISPKRTDAESSGRLKRLQFCRYCDEAVEETHNDCPRCGQPMPEAASCLFVESFEAEENLRIGSEEESRQRRYYRRKETLFPEMDAPVKIYSYAVTPAEYRRNANILITNWGRSASRTGEGNLFHICPDCGRHLPSEYLPKPGDDKREQARKATEAQRWSDDHRRHCAGVPAAVVLGYQFKADCLMLAVPAAPQDAEPETHIHHSPTILTLAEALLAGACDLLEIESHELSAFPRRSRPHDPLEEIVFFETVPGGAGYVEEMTRRLPEVAKSAQERLFQHECTKACYLCLKHFRNQRWHSSFDKRLVQGMLTSMSLMEPATVVEGKAGQAATNLRTLPPTVAQPDSPIEARLLLALKALSDMPEPEQQKEFRDEANGGRLVTVADFAYPDAKIAIFCDGFKFHAVPETAEKDAKKRNWLQAHKWMVLTYWGRTIMRDPDFCAKEIRNNYLTRKAQRQ